MLLSPIQEVSDSIGEEVGTPFLTGLTAYHSTPFERTGVSEMDLRLYANIHEIYREI